MRLKWASNSQTLECLMVFMRLTDRSFDTWQGQSDSMTLRQGALHPHPPRRQGAQESLIPGNCSHRQGLPRLAFLVGGYRGGTGRRDHCLIGDGSRTAHQRVRGTGGTHLRSGGRGNRPSRDLGILPSGCQPAWSGRRTDEALLQHLPQQLHRPSEQEPRGLPHGPPTQLAPTRRHTDL